MEAAGFIGMEKDKSRLSFLAREIERWWRVAAMRGSGTFLGVLQNSRDRLWESSKLCL